MLERFEVRQVETIAKPLQDGILYVSEKYGTAIHLCPSGCGEEVVTPFHDDTGWTLCYEEGGGITLAPSLLNKWCGAHYFIENSRVRWA